MAQGRTGTQPSNVYPLDRDGNRPRYVEDSRNRRLLEEILIEMRAMTVLLRALARTDPSLDHKEIT